jgi:hypothetical protein
VRNQALRVSEAESMELEASMKGSGSASAAHPGAQFHAIEAPLHGGAGVSCFISEQALSIEEPGPNAKARKVRCRLLRELPLKA